MQSLTLLVKLIMAATLSISLATAYGQESGNLIGGTLNKLFSGIITKQNTSVPKAKDNADDPLQWSATDKLTVEQAQTRFRKFFPMQGSDKFLDAPFEGWYFVVRNGDLAMIFNADITTMGLYNSWHFRRNNKLVPLDEMQMKAVFAELRQQVRPDAVIPAWQNNSQRNGASFNIVFTAPNCPACLQLDSQLNRLGAAVTSNIVFVPQILSSDRNFQKSFSASILCAPNPQAAFGAAFAERGRGSYVSPQGCTKEFWPALMAMAFYPGNSSLVNFQSGVSVPAVFSAAGKRITNAQWGSGLLTAKEVNSALSSKE
jgi:hypothetical protein